MIPKTREEKILYFMPNDVKPIWSKLSDPYQNAILQSSRHYIIDSQYKVELFWRTRQLEKYIKKTIRRIFSIEDPYGEENWEE